ncbi:MAG: type III pantothenate kinase [Cephaloticoccus sp.]|nr:type III pantothenate kinase [Cephaloticoccus sp.]MCF7760856.1 type III pantothenate kinase [Cephaloticoccus sp.]
MKTLALDLGNSTLLAGEFRGKKLVRQFRVPAAAVLSAGAFATEVAHRISSDVSRVVLCSVVPARTERLMVHLRRTLNIEPDVLTPLADHGLQLAYRRPAELGADRLANALGAAKLYAGRNVIVVDCGTATTLTLLRRDGCLLGGAIMPGLALWADMLAQRTARLPAVELQWPRQAVGRDTQAALRSGILHGHTGAIRELIRQCRREAFGRAAVVVLGTGGAVTHFKSQSLFTALEPGLILHGLQAFALRTFSHA